MFFILFCIFKIILETTLIVKQCKFYKCLSFDPPFMFWVFCGAYFGFVFGLFFIFLNLFMMYKSYVPLFCCWYFEGYFCVTFIVLKISKMYLQSEYSHFGVSFLKLFNFFTH